MWLERENYKEIRTALHKGREKDLDRVLHKIILTDKNTDSQPAQCPTCGKKLSNRVLPYLEFFVSACPDFHGAWVPPEMSKKLRDSIHEQFLISIQKSQAAKLVKFFGGLLIVFFLLNQFSYFIGEKYAAVRTEIENRKINERYWPERAGALLPKMPLETGIDSAEENFYFMKWSAVVTEGIDNRMNIDAVMQSKRSPEEYWNAFSYYRHRQEKIFKLLERMPVPVRLQDFHSKVLEGLDAQIAFYASFTKAKNENPEVTLQSLMKLPPLQDSDRALHEAYSIFLKLYPSIESFMHDAVEQRLCWFDIL